MYIYKTETGLYVGVCRSGQWVCTCLTTTINGAISQCFEHLKKYKAV